MKLVLLWLLGVPSAVGLMVSVSVLERTKSHACPQTVQTTTALHEPHVACRHAPD